MALIKVVLGFLLGLLLSGVLLFLISVRSPMPIEKTEMDSNASKVVATAQEPAPDAKKKLSSDDPVKAEEPAKETEPKAEDTDTTVETVTQEAEPEAPPAPELAEPEAPQTDVAEPKPATDADAPEVSTQVAEGTTPSSDAPSTESATNTDVVAEVDETAPVQKKPEEIAEPEAAQEETEQVAEGQTAPEEAPKTEQQAEIVEEDVAKPAVKLPTIGDDSGSRIKLSSDSDAPAETPKTFGAFELNAAQFAGSSEPLLAIVLVDVGAEGVSRGELSKLAFPATIAVPADQPDAAKAIELYRSSGKEVLLEAPSSAGMSLTSGINADEQQALLQDMVAKLPGAVGMVDNPLGELQKDRRLMKTVLDTFSESGHAILTFKKGLNSTAREAAKVNVPSGEVFRVLDEKKADKDHFGRVLKRAIIQASQTGGTIVMAHSKPETLAVLNEWIGSGGADGVVIAPVSAVVRKVSK